MTDDEHDDHKHHDHDHDHDKPWQAIRTEAMESLLSELGIVDSARVDEIVSYYEEKIGPKSGAKVIAKAWVDPAFKARLLANGLEACAELGLGGPETEYLHVVENTPTVHNVIVCTLCSCYPWTILGLPPAWYKSSAYRSRMVREPRRLLAEMNVPLDDSVKIQVWDSVSEIRYLVLPERPAGTEAMTEEELANIVTRDSMIGVSRLSI
jgi:nitrile hydratase